VANNGQGTTVTWNGVALGEVLSVSVDGISAETVDVTPRSNSTRFKSYSRSDHDYGTISVTARGTAAMSSTSVGLTAALSISGPGVSWSFSKAMFQKLGWSVGVGNLQEYSVSFKVGA